MKLKLKLVSVILLSLLLEITNSFAGTKFLTYEDAMKFRAMRGQIISEDGKYVAYFTYPDRGDYSGHLYSFEQDTTYTVPLGFIPKFNKSGEWTFFVTRPAAIEFENAEKEKPKNGLAIVENATGKTTTLKNVGKFFESNDGKWIAYEKSDFTPEKPDKKKKHRAVGKKLVLRNLPDAAEIELSDVLAFAFDSTSRYFAFSRADKDLTNNGLYIIDFDAKFALPKKVKDTEGKVIDNLAWNNHKTILAFTAGGERADGKTDSNNLCLYYPSASILDTIILASEIKGDLVIPSINKIDWTEDGNRLFFGLKQYADTAEYYDKIVYNDTNYYNIDTILTQTQLDMWHVKDPRIKPHQKKWWAENKDNTFAAYFDINTNEYVQLASEVCEDVTYVENPNYAIGHTDTPYMYASTWDLGAMDVYKVNMRDGEKKIVAEGVKEPGYLSPNGNYIAYYKDMNWYLHNNKTDETVNLTQNINTPFYDEDNDKPDLPYSYGLATWLDNDEGVLIYDKYDIWLFYTNNPTSPLCLTDAIGRKTKNQYRVINTDKKKKSYGKSETLLLTQYDTWNKNQGIAKLQLDLIGVQTVQMEQNLMKFIGKAKNAEKYIFSKESYDVFPDLWAANGDWVTYKKITDINPQISEYNYGKMHLVDYVSMSGDTLQGYYILPDNYDSKKRYPVVVWFYEIMSDDAHRYMMPWNNHLPQGPMYAGDDYVMFYPDVKFRVGSPGQSSIECLVPACRKLGEIGVADTNAIGLWGHSWSGYQAAYIVTQTDFFKAAVSGASVGNMTSAYSGIRFGSGLARQFQYEYQQSRIGGALWDSLDAYIRNSPVFFANKANTPILFEFGNEDDAVPFSQGVELFLAFRRAQKNAIMLEYRNEPHHPRKYFNRLDYAIRMKEFYDTYLKKKPAPEWIKKGIEFRGK